MFPRWLLLPLAVVAVPAPTYAGTEAPDPLRQAYADASRMLFDAAADGFQAAERRSPADAREARFGRAVTLLNAQPKTDNNVDAAAAMLAETVRGGADDEPGIAAAFLLGRIEQIHRRPPAPGRAVEIFDALHHAHPEHPLAQMAWVKSATVQLYDPALTDDARRARFTALEAAAAGLTDHDARRDAQLLLAAAAPVCGLGDERRLQHLVAAREIGPVKFDSRRDLDLAIGELARRLGQPALAAAHYRAFLEESQRDSRRFTVMERLAELREATPSPGAVPAETTEAAR